MKPINVIIADDHAVVRAGIRQFLERAPDLQVVQEAEDGEAAKTLIHHHRPDVVVLDIQMPRATGIEVTKWIRSQEIDVGILILTAYDDDPYVLAVLRAGANGYILKTANPDEIVQAVRDVHAGRSAIQTAVAARLLDTITGRLETFPIDNLTQRELEVLTQVAQGFTNRAIGVQLGISDRTVQGHLAKIFTKLQASSRTEAVMRAVSMGLLSPEQIKFE
jgi:DNA-binding NarL/FixJ family response regulator